MAYILQRTGKHPVLVMGGIVDWLVRGYPTETESSLALANGSAKDDPWFRRCCLESRLGLFLNFRSKKDYVAVVVGDQAVGSHSGQDPVYVFAARPDHGGKCCL